MGSGLSRAAGADGWLERTFKLKEHGTDVRTEVVAGITTFMTMAYIIFVNPGIVSDAGMPFDSALIATVVAAAVSTLLMALLANYPFALAPGMGLNAYFAYTIVLGRGIPWETALGAVFISGVLFVLLTLSRVREAIVDAVPGVLKVAISGGIGLFIAFIGAQNSGLIVANPATLVALGDLRSSGPLLALLGTVLTGGLLALRVRGAILWGIVSVTGLGMLFGLVDTPTAIVEMPRFGTWAPVFGKLDVVGALKLGFFEIVLVFLFVDLFDTLGTLIGVATRANMLDEHGRLPRVRPALLADAIGTMFGAVAGTPTATTYVESASGVAAGGRTGLTGVTVAAAFLLSLFFAPLVRLVADMPAATAPALIIVGALMMQAVVRIDWQDVSEAIPAFMTIMAMPLTYSIATGIAFGFITYPVVKVIAGRAKEVHWIVYVLAVLFALRFAFLGG